MRDAVNLQSMAIWRGGIRDKTRRAGAENNRKQDLSHGCLLPSLNDLD
jgi:hypothetical protein